MSVNTGTNWKNVNNWHWVDKNCLPWAKDYFVERLTNISVDHNGTSVSISEVTDVTGDCDLNQRKGQVINIFDLQLKLKWKGTNANGTEATGRIVMPEFMHDTHVDDLVFDIELESGNREKEDIKAVVRTHLAPILKTKFTDFSKDLMNAHHKDVFIPDHEMKGHPVLQTYNPKPPVAALAVEKSDKTKVVGGLVTIQQTVEFQCTAADLYVSLLNQARVQIWTRSNADIQEKVGSNFVLFGGNVTGTILELVPNQKIVMKWRLKQWPSEHYSHVTIEFKQGSDSTELKLVQKDVPIGEKNSTEQNWTNYYWNSLKRTFGFGSIL
ncbi:hypothetical protein HDV04_000963 [Boothiomyces sp. JEL0838]|nr:hypothetical protein HDV04_000963 [Boothiomyces sp. JEL0838]